MKGKNIRSDALITECSFAGKEKIELILKTVCIFAFFAGWSIQARNASPVIRADSLCKTEKMNFFMKDGIFSAFSLAS